MAEQNGEKSHDATPHRRQQAREKGQVAQSQDLGSAALLVAAVLILMSLGPALMLNFGHLLRSHLGGEAWLLADQTVLVKHFRGILSDLAGSLLPIFVLMMVVGIVIGFFQVGFLFVPERITPELSRISPWSGLKKMFSLTSVMRLSFGIFKVAVVASVALASLYSRQNEIVALTQLTVAPLAVSVSSIVLGTSLKIGLALLLLAIFDYMYQKWKHEQDLKMTTQEVREEMKNLQGDPQIIARRRAVQRQLVLNRLSDSVPKADVVVTNPTELAIAIQYDPETMVAPIVLAKGAGLIAARIRRLALENDIPIVEKKPLARALYKEVEPNHPVPNEQFAAVAEVLAYVYQLKGKKIPDPLAAA